MCKAGWRQYYYMWVIILQFTESWRNHSSNVLTPHSTLHLIKSQMIRIGNRLLSPIPTFPPLPVLGISTDHQGAVLHQGHKHYETLLHGCLIYKFFQSLVGGQGIHSQYSQCNQSHYFKDLHLSAVCQAIYFCAQQAIDPETK